MTPFLPPHDRRLKQRSSEIPQKMIHSQETQDLIDAMFKVAKGERGDPSQKGMVGLAAPQIGVLKRVILVDVGVDTQRRAWGELKAFINPRIVEQSNKIDTDREGCYSVDSHVCGIVPRSTHIKVAYQDRDGKELCEEYTDYVARIFQHEIDHLDGIRFPDRVGESGRLHWVEPDQYLEYRESWQNWAAYFPWKGWIAMQERKPYLFMQCPCRSELKYEECCGSYHEGKLPPTPLALMRSRYSGYALRKIDYIIETSHPLLQEAHLPFSQWKEQIAQFSDQTSFDGLEILDVQEGETEGFVTFKAHLSQNGNDLSFTEKSRFEKKDGKWLYHSGEKL